jgi:hypothetical protein
MLISDRMREGEDKRPCMRGAVTIEYDLVLKAGDHLHIAAWQREAGGATFLSIVLEVADKGARR